MITDYVMDYVIPNSFYYRFNLTLLSNRKYLITMILFLDLGIISVTVFVYDFLVKATLNSQLSTLTIDAKK